MKKTFDIAPIFRFSWQIYKKNWLLLIVLSFLALVVPSTLSLGVSHANPSLFFSLFTFLFTLLIDIVIYTVLFNLAGLLCFGVGVFITLPITWIGFAKIYVILAKTYD